MATRGNAGQRRRLKIIVLADLTRRRGRIFSRPGSSIRLRGHQIAWSNSNEHNHRANMGQGESGRENTARAPPGGATRSPEKENGAAGRGSVAGQFVTGSA
jgi:hypothetical protein